MSIGSVISLVVLLEILILAAAVRWLITGLRSAECREWPAIKPISAISTLPNPRDEVARSDDQVAAAS
jgi:hypothetical protein